MTSQFWWAVRWWCFAAFGVSMAMGLGLLLIQAVLPESSREQAILAAAYFCLGSQLPFFAALAASVVETALGHREKMRRLGQEAREAAAEETRRTEDGS